MNDNELSDTGRLLRADHPQSLKNWAAIQELWPALMSGLAETVRTGSAGHNDFLGGKGLYEWLAEHPEINRRFNLAMAETARLWFLEPLIDAFDWTSVATVVDIGGGLGALSIGLVERFPHLQATILDLPSVVAQSTEAITAAGLADRVRVVAGDYCEAVPEADVAIAARVCCNIDATRLRSMLEAVVKAAERTVIIDAAGDGAQALLTAVVRGSDANAALSGVRIGDLGLTLADQTRIPPAWQISVLHQVA